MGRKKRRTLELKPFCYYCERTFEDEKVLLLHQKARHFKCQRCNRKLDTATGLVVHLLQVHKETINKVPNAKPERDSPELVIHGMSGVPPHIIVERQQQQQLPLKTQPNNQHTVFGSGLVVPNGWVLPTVRAPGALPTPEVAAPLPDLASMTAPVVLPPSNILPPPVTASLSMPGTAPTPAFPPPVAAPPPLRGPTLIPGGILIFDDETNSPEENRAYSPLYNYRAPLIFQN